MRQSYAPSTKNQRETRLCLDSCASWHSFARCTTLHSWHATYLGSKTHRQTRSPEIVYIRFSLLTPRPPPSWHAHGDPSVLARVGIQQPPTQHLADLDKEVEGYLGKCVAPATRAAYASAQRRYATFCQQFKIVDPYPLSEGILCRFVAILAHEGLKHRTIKAYLSGLSFPRSTMIKATPSLAIYPAWKMC